MRQIVLPLIILITICQSLEGQWSFSEIGDGTKPSIHVDDNNEVHVTALKESTTDGFLSYLKINGLQATQDTVDEEYFYGPIDITTDGSGTPVIAFHHHNIGVDPFRGDLALATSTGDGNWTIDATLDQGHDGWDGTLAIDDQGTVHTVSNDPSNGTEYSAFANGQWTIEVIDSANAMYQYGTDIELDGIGNPHVVFFKDGLSTLRYAVKTNGVWEVEDIDTNAIYPSMILTPTGPLVVYYKAERNTTAQWATSGAIVMATRTTGSWVYSTIESLSNVTVGAAQTGARAIVDIQSDSMGTPHLAFANDRTIRYGTFDGNNWSLETIYNTDNQSFTTIGQQVSLDVESDGTAHVVTYRRTTGNDGIVIYGTSGFEPVRPTLICPPDTIISCEVLITPSNTGLPDSTGGFTRFDFLDTMIQECPADIILQRSWIGYIDDVPMDTCTQMITVEITPFDAFSIVDTLTVDEVCINDLDDVIQTDLALPCNVNIDSITIDQVERNCERIVLDATWTLANDCIDSTFIREQTIIIQNRVVAKLDETIITSDTGNASGGITLLPNCPFDRLTYEWSNGSTDSVLTNLMAGSYSVSITNNEGCIDSISYVVESTLTDTMMMDTMTMDTMTMDTMVMDTMMMDTMVMDTMVMDTMVMDTMVMDTMVMDTMVMDTMVMDTMVMDTMVMDTMVMDTMVMDTMVMDTMVMDTMVMDTMMMDTMVMDTMVMDTMMMDTMVMDTMMMDTMVMDTMVMDTMVMDTMVMDTMVMDTMVMDTMVMDTMVMDTMMMDTIPMDTVIKSSLGLSITDRNGSNLSVDSIYFMNPDSTFRTLPQDSSGAYIVENSLLEISGVCIDKGGLAIDSLSIQDLSRGQRIILQITDGCPEDVLALDVSDNKSRTAFDLALMRSVLLQRRAAYPSGLVYKFAKTDEGFDVDATLGNCILLDDKDRIRGSLKVMGVKLGDLKCSE